MALINRISRLFRADMHAVLDRLEEPDVLLRQAVREMEDETAKNADRLRRLHLETERLERREHEVGVAIAELDEQLDLCFQSGEEALARSLVKRKLPQTTLLARVQSDRKQVSGEIEQAARRHLEQQQRLESVRQKAELVGESRSPVSDEYGAGVEPLVSDDEVEVAFLREKSLRSAS